MTITSSEKSVLSKLFIQMFGYSILELVENTSRRRGISRARSALYYILRHKYNMSYPGIGNMLNKHHTTIMNGVDKTKYYMENENSDIIYKEKIDLILKQLRNPATDKQMHRIVRFMKSHSIALTVEEEIEFSSMLSRIDLKLQDYEITLKHKE